jgi:hypothetical protein
VLSLTAGTASMARAYTTGFVNNTYQSGQYDNFSHGPGDIGVRREAGRRKPHKSEVIAALTAN